TACSGTIPSSSTATGSTSWSRRNLPKRGLSSRPRSSMLPAGTPTTTWSRMSPIRPTSSSCWASGTDSGGLASRTAPPQRGWLRRRALQRPLGLVGFERGSRIRRTVMLADAKRKRQRDEAEREERERRRRQEEALDEALMDTFPASDPV